MAVQGDTKAGVLERLNRIEGQVRGIRRMVDSDSYCVDVLTQISAAHEALRSVGKLVMRSHLETCVTDAIRTGDDEKADRTYRELMDVIYKFAK